MYITDEGLKTCTDFICLTWQPMRNMDTKSIRNNASKYTLRTCNMWKQPGCLHLAKVQPETRSWSAGQWCIPTNKVSLNDAFLVRYIPEGPTRNLCHLAAIVIIGKRVPNLDPEVFCCKIWSKIHCYLNKHEIWPKYGILSQWWLHTELKKTPKSVFAVLSSSWRYPACDFWG